MEDPGDAAVLHRRDAQVRAVEALVGSWERAVNRGRAPDGFSAERDVAIAADRLRRALADGATGQG
ncbi:MAG TPA: hypothetical protein VGD11_14525 [Mycobacteriales bacterium]|jgi:hypothetical protein